MNPDTEVYPKECEISMLKSLDPDKLLGLLV